ncbi:hypothetical protein [Streptomyces cylindrosporus]|uniref:Uncharacterized protein n=1 Tax=Streptomyces cylindrosporus TaxID=2927583 RepID=A0ABS9YQG4_9ACTN|nr:hypothetical protein [Streptomyces cylindrosporus]MCI3279164.1 hypothetical protein [Streptomyces cylindrosporus]
MTLTAPDPTTRSGLGHPVVIGLDTSLSATGLASSNGWTRVVGYTDKKNPLSKLPHLERLAVLRTVRAGIINNIGRPNLVVLESPSLRSLGGAGHERGWLWWEIYSYLDSAEIPTALMSPSGRMLYATGKGQVPKGAVIDAVARRFPDWTTDGDDNAADAVVLMAAGRDWLGAPIATLPKTHRAALDKAVWPTLPGATR